VPRNATAFDRLANDPVKLPSSKKRGPDVDDIIAEFNRRYAVVNENGKAVVYELKYDTVLGRQVIYRIEFADLRKLYQNRRISVPRKDGETVSRSVADIWLNHEMRRTYLDGVVFDPTGKAPASYWNLWTGFAVEPREGDWSLMRDHVRKVICADDNTHFQYLMSWAAHMFQYPTVPGEVVPVLRGLKGAGKGIFASALVQAWGSHGMHIRDAKHLVGTFNAHLRDCVFLFADEAFFAGDRQHEGALKGLVTERLLPIEPKFRDLTMAINMLHIMMASNADWVVPASHDERRFFVLDVTDNRIGDRAYFSAIAKQMASGGLAAMIWDFMHADLAGFEVRNVPDSKGLADQKKHSMDSLDRWWLSVLDRGVIWRSKHGLAEFGRWHEFASTELLSRSYLQWCAENRISRPMTRVQLGQRMTEIYQRERPRGLQIVGEVEAATRTNPGSLGLVEEDLIERNERPPGYRVGTLEEARACFADQRGVTGEWEE
jgi:hypothetical protein